MTEFILHIGTHKTGTTAIQAYLSGNRERLLELGVDFPVVGRTPAGSQAHRHFSALCRNIVNEIPAGFQQAISNGFTSAEKCILSSEDFWFCADHEAIERAHDLVGSDAKIVCYLREPVSHIFSMYREAIKGGEVARYDEFVGRFRKGLTERNKYGYYRYQERLGNWKERWPVVVVRYRNGDDAVGSFLAQSGIAVQTDGWPDPGRRNEAMSDVATMMLLRCNRMMESRLITPAKRKEYKTAVQRMSNALQAEHASLLIFEAINMHPLKAAFAKQNPDFAAMCDATEDVIGRPMDISLPDNRICELLNGI